MKIDDNGTIRDLNPEEEAEYLANSPTAHVPTAEERLQALESAMLDIIMGV